MYLFGYILKHLGNDILCLNVSVLIKNHVKIEFQLFQIIPDHLPCCLQQIYQKVEHLATS